MLDRGHKIHVALRNTTKCFTDAGFSDDCAYLWASNSLNSKVSGCAEDCILWLGDIDDPTDLLDFSNPTVQSLLFSANDPETCDLNECLACDDEESGEIFKKYSGRTRRNSGILTVVPVPYPFPAEYYQFAGLKRPCNSIAEIFQVYAQSICSSP
jgi:hypothetical protein